MKIREKILHGKYKEYKLLKIGHKYGTFQL